MGFVTKNAFFSANFCMLRVKSNIFQKQCSPSVEIIWRFLSWLQFFFVHRASSCFKSVQTRLQKDDTSSHINGQHGLTQILQFVMNMDWKLKPITDKYVTVWACILSARFFSSEWNVKKRHRTCWLHFHLGHFFLYSEKFACKINVEHFGEKYVR